MIVLEMFFVVLAFESMEMLNKFLLTQDLDMVSDKRLVLAESDTKINPEEIGELLSDRSKYCLLCPMSLMDAKLVDLIDKGDAS